LLSDRDDSSLLLILEKLKNDEGEHQLIHPETTMLQALTECTASEGALPNHETHANGPTADAERPHRADLGAGP
jgi:hypothetical protein